MATVLVWDVETDCSFSQLNGMCREQQMRVMQATVICAWEFRSCDSVQVGNWNGALEHVRKHTWWRDEAADGKTAFSELLELLDRAEVNVAYNGLGFDFAVIRKYYGFGRQAKARYMQHRIKCLDPMHRIASSVDIPFPKLEALLVCNKLGQKSGDGLNAIKLWEQGKREELCAYCAQDVGLLAQLVHLAVLEVPNLGTLPNRVHGVASAIRAHRALQPVPMDEDFVLVGTGEGPSAATPP